MILQLGVALWQDSSHCSMAYLNCQDLCGLFNQIMYWLAQKSRQRKNTWIFEIVTALLFIMLPAHNSECLKSELLKSELVWNSSFCEFGFQTSLCVWKPIQKFSLQTHLEKVSEIWTVWKPNIYWVSEINICLDFRHSLCLDNVEIGVTKTINLSSIPGGWQPVKKIFSIANSFIKN